MPLYHKIEQDFLNEQKKQAACKFRGLAASLRKSLQESKLEVCSDLIGILNILKQDYMKLQQAGLVDPLSYIQISFLRTGLVSGHDIYTVNLFDKNWVLSEVSANSYWTPEYFLIYYTQFQQELYNAFWKQSKVRLYEADYIIREYDLKFHNIMVGFLKAEIKGIIDSMFSDSRGLKVAIGEYMDHNTIIYMGK